MTFASAPKLRIQLRSAKSFDTFSVTTIRPSTSSRTVCELCHMRSRIYGAIRRSKTISTCSGVP